MRLPSTSLSPMLLFTAACVAVALVGMRLDLERFITPETGVGYWLGIVGGSAMLLLLIYPARKRVAWLAAIGSVKAWFEVHMVLGVVGPLLVLFHSNFSTGATNSNVALACMLAVSGSGLVGRYFYSRIHTQLYGHQSTLEELRGQIARMQMVSQTLAWLPEFQARLEAAEARMIAGLERTPGFLRLPLLALRAMVARARMAHYIRIATIFHAHQRGVTTLALKRQAEAARELARRHIDLVRRVRELSSYERLFSLWHILHLPLFFMLLVAGIVHVVAVHLY